MSTERDLRLDPYPWYAEMLKVTPVTYNEQFGAYLIFRFDEIKRVFSEPRSFSSKVYEGLTLELPTNNIQAMDPPRHTQLRALATHAFTPKAVADLEPRIRDIVNGLLDQMLEKDDIDFVRDFAVPFPVMVIAEMLGIPVEDRPHFKRWSDIILQGVERLTQGFMEELPEHVAGYREMLAYFEEIVSRKRNNPQNDLISRIATAEVEGNRLTDAEAANFCVLLLVAGNETTTNLLSNAMRTFAEYPDQWELLGKTPELLPQAVDEVLRYRTPAQFIPRIVMHDVEIGGAQLTAGDRVILFMGAANRDPAKFENPNTFDITRPVNQHISFGHGIHYCLGAPLARLETTIALKAILERISEYRIPAEGELEPLSGLNMLGLRRLPLRLITRSVLNQ